MGEIEAQILNDKQFKPLVEKFKQELGNEAAKAIVGRFDLKRATGEQIAKELSAIAIQIAARSLAKDAIIARLVSARLDQLETENAKLADANKRLGEKCTLLEATLPPNIPPTPPTPIEPQ